MATQSDEAEDPLHVIRNNRRDRINRKDTISTQEIHRFNMLQGSIPEKSEQWIDANCPSFSQTIKNRSIYGSEETTQIPVTPLTKSSHSLCGHPKSNSNNKKYIKKSAENTKSNKCRKRIQFKTNSKKRRKCKNRKQNTQKIKKTQVPKHVNIDLTVRSQSQSKKHKKNPKQVYVELLSKIKRTLTKAEYKTFAKTVKLLHCMKDSNDIQQFQQHIITPFIYLFAAENRQYLLHSLSSIIPSVYKRHYKQKIRAHIKSKTKKNELSSQEWHCTECNMCNMSSLLNCEGCLKPKSKSSNNMIVNGAALQRISGVDSERLGYKLDALRERLKAKYNIRQLHYVFSQPILDLLGRYAPIEVAQLGYFDIPPMKIDQYGSEIVNVIKEYLHENEIVSPFLRQRKVGSRHLQPPMFGRRHRNYNYNMELDGTDSGCKYCCNLFDINVIAAHQRECVMRHIGSNLAGNSKEIIIIDDDCEDNETNKQKEVEKAIEIDMDEKVAMDVNMNDNIDANEKELLALPALERVDRGENKNNNNGEREDGNVNINYFDGIDDVMFTQIIMEEKKCNENKINEENENDDGYVNDNEMLQCLERTEERIKNKNNIKNKLQAKKLKLHELKQQEFNVEGEVRDLERKLLDFS